MSKSDFIKVYEEYFAAMCLYATKLTGDELVAKDIANEVFLRIWEKVNLSQIKNVPSYLYMAVRHACIDHFNTVKRTGELQKGPEYTMVNFPNADQEMMKTELLRQLSIALEALPEPYQQVLKMSYIDQLKGKEIAEKLAVSMSTVDKQKAKGLAMLRNTLGKSAFALLPVVF